MQDCEEQATIIPFEQISTEALNGVIESFILREGSDYGDNEVEFETKKQQVYKQIQSQKVIILYDVKHASIQLMNKQDWQKTIQT